MLKILTACNYRMIWISKHTEESSSTAKNEIDLPSGTLAYIFDQCRINFWILYDVRIRAALMVSVIAELEFYYYFCQSKRPSTCTQKCTLDQQLRNSIQLFHRMKNFYLISNPGASNTSFLWRIPTSESKQGIRPRNRFGKEVKNKIRFVPGAKYNKNSGIEENIPWNYHEITDNWIHGCH